jgi:hypothetical protein
MPRYLKTGRSRFGVASPLIPLVLNRGEVWTVLSDLLNESDQGLRKEEEWNAGCSRRGHEGFKSYWKATSTALNFAIHTRLPLLRTRGMGKTSPLNSAFEAGDLLVLQVLEGSPLLTKPPPDFYKTVNRSVRSSLFGTTFDHLPTEYQSGRRP